MINEFAWKSFTMLRKKIWIFFFNTIFLHQSRFEHSCLDWLIHIYSFEFWIGTHFGGYSKQKSVKSLRNHGNNGRSYSLVQWPNEWQVNWCAWQVKLNCFWSYKIILGQTFLNTHEIEIKLNCLHVHATFDCKFKYEVVLLNKYQCHIYH